jgi:hypothetical protein
MLFCLTQVIFVKSGKHTFGKGYFWSGCDNDTKAGLEIGGIAVGDIINHTAFHYEAIQTPNQQQLKEQNSNLLQHYAHLLIERKDELATFSSLLAVDCYFSKHSFVDNMLKNTDFNIISRLRDDAVLLYPYMGATTGKKRTSASL